MGQFASIYTCSTFILLFPPAFCAVIELDCHIDILLFVMWSRINWLLQTCAYFPAYISSDANNCLISTSISFSIKAGDPLAKLLVGL